eukprot:COSAG03_NODE_6185_length_1100_cov_1.492507_1_plen_148_part_00
MSIVAVDPADIALVYAGCPGCDFSNGTAVTFDDLEKGCDDFLHDDVEPRVAIAVLVSWMVIWVGMLSKELRIANVGGCIGLHYFEQDIGGTRAVSSLKWSLTSNFGSLCYCSLILTVIEIIDRMIDTLRDNARCASLAHAPFPLILS